MAAHDTSVRISRKAHSAFAKLHVAVEEDIKELLSIAASTPAIMKALREEAMRRKAHK